MSGALIEVRELAAMMAGHTDILVGELLPAARRVGGDWKAGSLDGEPGQSLHVWGRGAKRGEWFDFAAGQGGDMIDLVAAAKTGGDIKAAILWSKRYLGLDNADRKLLEKRRARIAESAEAHRRESEVALKKARNTALATFMNATQIAGTPADAYLKARGIRLDDLPRTPGSLRFVDKLYCAETGQHLPAMIAAIAAPAAGGFLSIHRTWLEFRGGRWDKAALAAPRKAYCAYAGGWIEIGRGSSGRKIKYAQAGETVAIAEGIEDALAVAVARPDLRVLSAVSLANIAAISATLPRAIDHVMIAADNDWQGSSAAEALERAVGRHRRSGRAVAVVRSAVGKDMADWAAALARQNIERAEARS